MPPSPPPPFYLDTSLSRPPLRKSILSSRERERRSPPPVGVPLVPSSPPPTSPTKSNLRPISTPVPSLPFPSPYAMPCPSRRRRAHRKFHLDRGVSVRGGSRATVSSKYRHRRRRQAVVAAAAAREAGRFTSRATLSTPFIWRSRAGTPSPGFTTGGANGGDAVRCALLVEWRVCETMGPIDRLWEIQVCAVRELDMTEGTRNTSPSHINLTLPSKTHIISQVLSRRLFPS